ncbi:MAG: phasin family protein [Thiotrichaceae bacterium]|nr:phasin family protein [Thiotrichaceae bacterium]
MSNEMLQKWTELNRSSMDSVKELGDINTKMMTRLTQRQMDMMNLYMEGSAKQMEVMGDSKDPQDIAGTQSGLYTEMNEKLMDNARQTLEVLMEAKAELTSWAEKGVSQATELTKK